MLLTLPIILSEIFYNFPPLFFIYSHAITYYSYTIPQTLLLQSQFIFLSRARWNALAITPSTEMSCARLLSEHKYTVKINSPWNFQPGPPLERHLTVMSTLHMIAEKWVHFTALYYNYFFFEKQHFAFIFIISLIYCLTYFTTLSHFCFHAIILLLCLQASIIPKFVTYCSQNYEAQAY